MVDSHMVDCKTGEIYTCENKFTALCGLTNHCLVGIKGGAPGCHSNREQHSANNEEVGGDYAAWERERNHRN